MIASFPKEQNTFYCVCGKRLEEYWNRYTYVHEKCKRCIKNATTSSSCIITITTTDSSSNITYVEEKNKKPKNINPFFEESQKRWRKKQAKKGKKF